MLILANTAFELLLCVFESFYRRSPAQCCRLICANSNTMTQEACDSSSEATDGSVAIAERASPRSELTRKVQRDRTTSDFDIFFFILMYWLQCQNLYTSYRLAVRFQNSPLRSKTNGALCLTTYLFVSCVICR